ncbi:MAG: O-antigen polymerase [Verrucomicrobiota bacterium]
MSSPTPASHEESQPANRRPVRGKDIPPAPELTGTFVILAGLLITRTLATGETPSDIASTAAKSVGLTFAIACLLDLSHGFRNLMRADLMMLVALYGLLFAEFLFPQASFDLLLNREMLLPALDAVYLGIAGVAVGRHFGARNQGTLSPTLTEPVSPRLLTRFFWLAFVLGYSHQWLSVNFNPAAWFDAMTEVRFSQPWSRGRLGNWKALVYELGMLIYVIPPLGAIIIVRRKMFDKTAVTFVVLATLLTFFYGFSSGTRNIFAIYVITFAIAYSFFLHGRSAKQIVLTFSAIIGVIFLATNYMLAFRNIGLQHYVSGLRTANTDERESLFVDLNLYNITAVTETFGKGIDFLGWEVPYLAIVRPIPRALWPGKPEGLSTTVEEAVGTSEAGAGNVTLSTTFIGEAYTSGGYPAVLMFSLVLGAFGGWWNRFGISRISELGVLIYASGFFSISIAMRSVYTFTTAILPTILLALLASWLYRQRHPQLRRQPTPENA